MAEQLRAPFEKFVDSPFSKKKPSPHLHEISTRSNKLSPRIYMPALSILALCRRLCLIHVLTAVLDTERSYAWPPQNMSPFYISRVELHSCLHFEHSHYHDFEWLLPVSCIFWLYNRKGTESGTPDLKRGSVCALVSYRWCGGGGALILQTLQFQQMTVRCKFSGWTGLSHFGPNQCFV
jgi:hypothetical protein